MVKNCPIYVVFGVILIAKISLIHKNYFQTHKMQIKDFSFHFIKCLYSRIDRDGEAHCKRIRNSWMIGHLAAFGYSRISIYISFSAALFIDVFILQLRHFSHLLFATFYRAIYPTKKNKMQ